MLKKKMLISFVLLAVMVVISVPLFAAPNLKGFEMTLGKYWDGYDVNTYKPRNEVDALVLDYRQKLLAKEGFKMSETQVADWNGMLATTATSIMSGKPAAKAFYMQADWAMTLYRRGLLAPISDQKAGVKLNASVGQIGKQTAWNQEISGIFTFGKKIYAIAPGYGTSEHGAGIYFNKRLFKEAGIDPDLPYNKQKDGTWTWAELLRISKILTRDTRNTGQINTWAMPADLSTEILDQIVFSNGADYISKDKQGKFVNSTNTAAFIEALQFARTLREQGVMMPRPEGSEWDWYWPAFIEGKVAMVMEPEWRRQQLSDKTRMIDDWGFVLFPKGPKAKDYRFPNDENVIVIPSTYKGADLDKIVYALELWFRPVTDNWKEGLYTSFRDRRAVDDTMAMIRSPKYGAFRSHILIPGLNRGDIAWNMWWFDGEPAQLVESVSQNWNDLVKNANEIE